MKLLKKSQIREWDQYTVAESNFSSFDLMQRASAVFANWFQSIYYDKSRSLHIFCGMGNNGGDGFCVANILEKAGYQVELYLFEFGSKFSAENLESQSLFKTIKNIHTFESIQISNKGIIIDALLGSGIKGPLKGEYLELIDWINTLSNEVISIDIPSGMNPDSPTLGSCVKANHVLSFEIPKLAFFLDENTDHLENWEYRSIGLSKKFLSNLKVKDFLIHYDLVKSILKPRERTQNKKNFGFAQFCGGSPGIFGSVTLAAMSAMRCGLGRLAVSTPSIYHSSLFACIPEAMAQANLPNNEYELLDFQIVNSNIDAIALGPGLGTSDKSVNYIDQFLNNCQVASILDADALNIIARNNWQSRLNKNTIICPHKEEFERLFGQCETHYIRIQKQILQSKKLNILIILKGAYTTITTPDGSCYYNDTGNVGMGTAGSGDVLTGMLLSFLAQGYSAKESCILGVHLHGLAGDAAALKYGQISLIASDIIEFIPTIIKNINGK